MMMVPYMFNEALMDDLFSNDWERDFDRAMSAAAPPQYVWQTRCQCDEDRRS